MSSRLSGQIDILVQVRPARVEHAISTLSEWRLTSWTMAANASTRIRTPTTTLEAWHAIRYTMPAHLLERR